MVRVFAHSAIGRRIDPSCGELIELFLIPASAPRLLWDGAYKRTLSWPIVFILFMNFAHVPSGVQVQLFENHWFKGFFFNVCCLLFGVLGLCWVCVGGGGVIGVHPAILKVYWFGW